MRAVFPSLWDPFWRHEKIKYGFKCPCLDVCSLPKVVGPCMAAFPRWFFNKASGQCEEFIYGGCKGNDNFAKQEECRAMCLTNTGQ